MRSIKCAAAARACYIVAMLMFALAFGCVTNLNVALADEATDEDTCVAHILNADGSIAENGHIESFGTTEGQKPDIKTFNTTVSAMTSGQTLMLLDDLILDNPGASSMKNELWITKHNEITFDMNGHKTNAAIHTYPGENPDAVLAVQNGELNYENSPCRINALSNVRLNNMKINVSGTRINSQPLFRTADESGRITVDKCAIIYDGVSSGVGNPAYIAQAYKGKIIFTNNSSIVATNLSNPRFPVFIAEDGGTLEIQDTSANISFNCAKMENDEDLITMLPRALYATGSGSSVSVCKSTISCNQLYENGKVYCIGASSLAPKDDVVPPTVSVSDSVLKATAEGDAAAIYMGASSVMYPYATAELTIDGAMDLDAPIILAQDKAINVGSNLALAEGASPIDVVVGGYEFNAANAAEGKVINYFLNDPAQYGHADGTLTDDVFAVGVDGADISSKAACFVCPPSAGKYDSPYSAKSIIKTLAEGNKLAFADKDLSAGTISVEDIVQGSEPAVNVTYADEPVPADCYSVIYLDENGDALEGIPNKVGTYFAVATANAGFGYESSITSAEFRVLAAASSEDVDALNEQIEQLKTDLAAAKEQLADAATKEELSAANATIAALQAQLDELKAQVAELSKAEQTIKVTPASKSFKASKKTKKLAKAKSFTIKVAGAKGTVTKTFKITKKASKKISVSKAGKVQLKKGAKKGTYKIKVTVKATGNNAYKAKTYTKTITIKVK